jgi:hypothetical protein
MTEKARAVRLPAPVRFLFTCNNTGAYFGPVQLNLIALSYCLPMNWQQARHLPSTRACSTTSEVILTRFDMAGTRVVRLLTIGLGSILGSACAEYATGPGSSIRPPSTTVQFRGLGTGTGVKAVRWSSDRGGSQTSGTIGPRGGTLSIPGADFTIVFPKGALKDETVITIVALDHYVGYDMLPHGLQFARPVIATQGLGNVKVNGPVFCAYLAPGQGIGTDGLATAAEIESSTTDFGLDLSGRPQAVTQLWTLNHFSRYILASGVEQSDDPAPPSN